MTVTTTDVLAGPYYPNGAARAFPFKFKAYDATDLRVFDRTPTGDVDYDASLYSVTLGDTSGNVIFTVAPAAGAELWIALSPPFTNNISFGIEESFFPQAHNEGFDRGAMRDQFLKERTDRALLMPQGSEGVTFKPSDKGIVGVFNGAASLQPLNDFLASSTTNFFDDGPWGGDFTDDTNDGVWG